MKTRFKKIVSLILTAVMLLGTVTVLVPMTASAEESNVAINADGSVNIPKNEDFTYQGITYRFDVREGNTESYAKILTNGSVEFKLRYGDMLWFPDITTTNSSAIHAEVTGIERENTDTMGNAFYGVAYGVKRDSDNGAFTVGNAAVSATRIRLRLTGISYSNTNAKVSDGWGNGGDLRYQNGTTPTTDTEKKNWKYIAGSDNTNIICGNAALQFAMILPLMMEMLWRV